MKKSKVLSLLAACLCTSLVSTLLFADDSNDENPPAIAINPQLLEVQHRLTVLEHEMKLRKSPINVESSASVPPNEFLEVAMQHWTHSNSGILICMKIMREGQCYENGKGTLGKEERIPHPWYTPQELIDFAHPGRDAKLVDIDYYPPERKLFLFYAINKEAGKIQ